MNNRVVITGLGVISPIGTNTSEFWDSIVEGKHGISLISAYDVANEKVKLAAEVKNLNFGDFFKRKEINRLDRFSLFGLLAADEAFIDAGLHNFKYDPYRMGVSIGTGLGGIGTITSENSNLISGGMNTVSPLLLPKSLGNILSGNIAIKYGAKNSSNTIVTACASSTNAIGEGFLKIKSGMADLMIAGGSEACIHQTILAGFTNMNAVTQSSDPNKASIPFDKDRNGFVLGEGSGMLILESYEHAVKRNAKIYAEIVGYGYSNDAYHLTSPEPNGEGAVYAMKSAIENAGILPSDISYINAHGTSTTLNDEIESGAISKIFNKQTPISSTKSMIGHLQGAAGAVEAVVCVKSIETDTIHGNVNYISTDIEYGLNYISQLQNTPVEYALSNSFGFGGHNACLIFKKIGM